MRPDFENGFFRSLLGICVLALLLVAGMYSYLGTFSRYGGDDYCEAARIRASSPLGAVFDRYFNEDWPRATMRYSNLLFVGIGESLGRYNMQITMAFMVVLWFAGCVWCTYEVRRLLKVGWSVWVDVFLGLTFGFLCFKTAPNLFESVYWRSAMMTHFAPLVFGLFLFSFLIKQAREISEGRSPSWLIYLLIFTATFIIAGFSEPPTTTLLTMIPLGMFAIWCWGKSPARGKYLALLGAVFAGALFGLVAMLVSPATSGAEQARSLSAIQLLMNSFLYSYQFVFDSLKTQPLPLFLAAVLPFLFFWLFGQIGQFTLSSAQKRLAVLIMITAPFLAWLLIAAGFSPSVFGQSFPVERSRFLAQAIVVATLMVEGASLGLLLAQYGKQAYMLPGKLVAAVLFIMIGLGYPLRTAADLFQYDLPAYRARATLWDARDADIRAMKDDGLRELTVPFLSSEIIQDLGDRREYRLNRCASVLYGVESILALPMDGE